MDSSNIDFNTNSILLNTLINKLNYASPSEIQRKVINADLPSNNRNIFIIKSDSHLLPDRASYLQQHCASKSA